MCTLTHTSPFAYLRLGTCTHSSAGTDALEHTPHDSLHRQVAGSSGELCEQRCAAMIQSPRTSAAQVPRGERCRQWGWRACTHSLRSRGCVLRHHRGQRAWDLPTALPGGRSWGLRGNLSRPAPFTSSQTVGRADVTGPRVSSDLPTLSVTALVRVLLGLASTFHPFQLCPVSSPWACSVSWTVL